MKALLLLLTKQNQNLNERNPYALDVLVQQK